MNAENNQLFETWLSRWEAHTNKTRAELLEMAIVKEHLKDLQAQEERKQELYINEAQSLKINCS